MNTLVTVTYTVFKSIESLRRQRSSLIALRWRGNDGQSKVCQRDNKDEYEHGSKIKFDRSGREHENRLSHADHCLLLIFIHSGMVTYRRGRDWKIFIFKCIVKSQWNTHTAVVVLYTLTYEDGDGLAYEVFFSGWRIDKLNSHFFFLSRRMLVTGIGNYWNYIPEPAPTRTIMFHTDASILLFILSTENEISEWPPECRNIWNPIFGINSYIWFAWHCRDYANSSGPVSAEFVFN